MLCSSHQLAITAHLLLFFELITAFRRGFVGSFWMGEKGKDDKCVCIRKQRERKKMERAKVENGQ